MLLIKTYIMVSINAIYALTKQYKILRLLFIVIKGEYLFWIFH